MTAEWHDVWWQGVYAGTDDDPREIGWCPKCETEVYEALSGPHRKRRPAGGAAKEPQHDR